MRLLPSREMSEEEVGKSYNNSLWEGMRYALGSNYQRIIELTGCRDYIYGEDPNVYFDIVAECYGLYCKIYNDEAEYRESEKRSFIFASFSSLPRLLEILENFLMKQENYPAKWKIFT